LAASEVASRQWEGHNRSVPHNGWKRRIERGQELAAQYAFAAEILHFYLEIAQFQENLFKHLEIASAENSPAEPQGLVSGPPELSELISSFRPFLALVEEKGPRPLAADARELRSGSQEVCVELLNDFWDSGPDGKDTSADTHEFFARAFLQPYAEFLRLRSDRKWDGYNGSSCPFCGRKPGFGALRQQGDGGRRCLICSFCMAEWEFRRIVCPACGEEDHKKLPVYSAVEFAHVRVECCDRCQLYIKTVDLTKIGRAEPMIDELASVPLDLWAQEHGYTKLQKNLLQL
jgi:formate dehydrogenase accessory protein FdhE